jgi:hypothetical protein
VTVSKQHKCPYKDGTRRAAAGWDLKVGAGLAVSQVRAAAAQPRARYAIGAGF